jgi:hypothetical protein
MCSYLTTQIFGDFFFGGFCFLLVKLDDCGNLRGLMNGWSFWVPFHFLERFNFDAMKDNKIPEDILRKVEQLFPNAGTIKKLF